jgi:hypothetical protein
MSAFSQASFIPFLLFCISKIPQKCFPLQHSTSFKKEEKLRSMSVEIANLSQQLSTELLSLNASWPAELNICSIKGTSRGERNPFS